MAPDGKSQGGSTGSDGPSEPERRSKPLRALYDAHKGKVSDKWSIYLDTYDRAFLEFRTKPIRLLEIGVQNGGSLEIWREYFPRATLVVGCDINDSCGELKFNDENIHVIVGNIDSEDVKKKLRYLSDKFDIIIDDGSHKSSDIIGTFACYFPCLEEGGIYLVEDLHCSYWEEFGGGLYDPLSSMSFFKRLLDVVNHEHWGLDRNRLDALATFADKYGISLSEASLASMHALTFVNSLCIIEKRSSEQNVLGPRHIAGQDASINARIVSANRMIGKASDQMKNPWSLQMTTMEEEIVANRDLARRLKSEESRGRLLEIELERTTKLAQELTILAQGLQNSTSWRITAPLRKLSTAAKLMRRKARLLS